MYSFLKDYSKNHQITNSTLLLRLLLYKLQIPIEFDGSARLKSLDDMESARVAVMFFKSLVFLLILVLGNALSLNHYEQTCPNAELTVASVVKKATAKDKTIPATLLRMHFHDCFLRV